MAEHLYTYVDPVNRKHLDQIVEVLRGGGLLAMPAGTNWVFAADPTSKKALARLQQLKPNRPEDRPYALLCADISMATDVATVDGRLYKLLKRAWPGPYTIILPSGRGLARMLTTKRKVVGVRVPDDPLAMAILDAWQGPLLISTVPKGPDGQLRTLGFEVAEAFERGVDLVVDLGEPLPGTETTVLDLADGDLQVIRQGAGDLAILGL